MSGVSWGSLEELEDLVDQQSITISKLRAQVAERPVVLDSRTAELALIVSAAAVSDRSPEQIRQASMEEVRITSSELKPNLFSAVEVRKLLAELDKQRFILEYMKGV